MDRFSELEARANRSILQKLANATAIINSQNVPVIFDDKSLMAQVGVIGFVGAAPQIVLSSSDVPAGFDGMSILVVGKNWHVAQIMPDGSGPAGLTVVQLEQA